MEVNDFFPNHRNLKPYDAFPNDQTEDMPIKKVLSLKLNVPRNFVPILKPKRVCFSTKAVHFFSLDKDGSISSDSDDSTPTIPRNKEINEKRRNSSTAIKQHNKQISHFEDHHDKSKKSLFFAHLHKVHEMENDSNGKDNNKDVNKLEIIGDNNEEIRNDKDDENNDNEVESFVL